LEEFLHTWESTKDGCIQVVVCGEKITIDQTLIVQLFGVNVEGAVDATKTLVNEARVVFKNIARLDAFVNKEHWNVIRMEEYHIKFAAILQIIYQQKRLAYFSNHIAISLNLANKGKKIK
jgi:hypothetical protein